LEDNHRVVPNGWAVKIMSQEIKTFQSGSEFRDWLAKYHAETDGVWLRIFKKDSGEKSLTHAEALDEALCYGWIDGQAKGYDKHPGFNDSVPDALPVAGLK
jgi:uncharacterized protein YdeI (YjbR/CyaY-like superfamily)